MSNGIQDFYKTASSAGFARKNLFRITQITNDIYIPDESGNLFLYAQDSTVPSRDISTAFVNFKAFNFNIPMNATYPEAKGGWSVTFMCDRDYVLRDMFEKWSVKTFDEHTSTSTTNWWDTDVELSLLKNSGIAADPNIPSSADLEAIKKYTLKGAYPTSVGSMQYSVGDAGNIVTMQVRLGFQYLISETNT